MTYNQKLEAHLADAKEYADKYFTITAFGSMNYGLDDENSDFDTKMIVLPSLKDICLAKSPISTTIIRGNNEHIEVRDLRLFDKSWRKQGLSALELLFSPYFKTCKYGLWKNIESIEKKLLILILTLWLNMLVVQLAPSLRI